MLLSVNPGPSFADGWWWGGCPWTFGLVLHSVHVPQSLYLVSSSNPLISVRRGVPSYCWGVHSHEAACKGRGFFGAIWAPSSECRATATHLKKNRKPSLKKINTKCPGSHRQIQMHPKGLNAIVTFKNLSSVSCFWAPGNPRKQQGDQFYFCYYYFFNEMIE